MGTIEIASTHIINYSWVNKLSRPTLNELNTVTSIQRYPLHNWAEQSFSQNHFVGIISMQLRPIKTLKLAGVNRYFKAKDQHCVLVQ